MRISVGSVLLGSSPQDVEKKIVSGFSASASPQVQESRGACGGLGRIKLGERGVASFQVPTTLTFDSVADAEKFCVDTALAGGYEGQLSIEYADAGESVAEWAVAIPRSITYVGVLVSATWDVRAGNRLT